VWRTRRQRRCVVTSSDGLAAVVVAHEHPSTFTHPPLPSHAPNAQNAANVRPSGRENLPQTEAACINTRSKVATQKIAAAPAGHAAARIGKGCVRLAATSAVRDMNLLRKLYLESGPFNPKDSVVGRWLFVLFAVVSIRVYPLTPLSLFVCIP